MLLADAERLERAHGKLTLLDIGCGGGFDRDPALQRTISEVADHYIGIEPDTSIQLENIFSSTHRCRFEDAPIRPQSIDLAFAVMVLEHVANPAAFWDKLRGILKKGGVFWGFTVDARHWFVFASLVAERLGLKDWYLTSLHGKRGEERYENYGVYYRCNTPRDIQEHTSAFASRVVLNGATIGQMDYYFPRALRGIGRVFDRLAIRLGWPGNLMAVRVEK